MTDDPDDDPTRDVPALTDAQLLAEYYASRRIEDDMCRAIGALNEPREGSDDDGT